MMVADDMLPKRPAAVPCPPGGEVDGRVLLGQRAENCCVEDLPFVANNKQPKDGGR